MHRFDVTWVLFESESDLLLSWLVTWQDQSLIITSHQSWPVNCHSPVMTGERERQREIKIMTQKKTFNDHGFVEIRWANLKNNLHIKYQIQLFLVHHNKAKLWYVYTCIKVIPIEIQIRQNWFRLSMKIQIDESIV